MLNEVLKVILSMSLSGGIVVVMLFFVLLLYGKKLSRQWQYYIWLMAIVRLLVPFAPQQNLMNVLFQSAEKAVSASGNLLIEDFSSENFSAERIANEQSQAIDEKLAIKLQGSEDEGLDETVGQTVDKQHVSLNIVREYLWLIWMLPAVILLIRKIAVYRHFIKYIRAGSEDVQDIDLLEQFGKLLGKNHIRSTIVLSANSIITSPVMIGFFKPRIILPTTDITDSEFEHTILHELVHYRRRDILYKWLTQITVCIHWFNPLVYVLQRRINRACELSCDEAVIRRLDAQERYAYGDTLLRAAGRNTKYKNPVSSISFSNSKKHLKERLDAIMNFQKRTKATFLTTLVLTVIIFISSAYSGVYAAAKRDVSKEGKSKTETSDAQTEQAAYFVLYKNGEYFILFDGADEDNIPGSTGPDYGITFGAVWADSAYVSFDSYHINKNLTKKIEKDCTYMQKKGWLTPKEANAIIAVASKVQEGDTDGFQKAKQEEEYGQWKIQKRNSVYYYNNKRIRILMDTRKDRSFKNFNYDQKGKVDIKIVRNKKDQITKIKYLSKKKAKKILEDLK